MEGLFILLALALAIVAFVRTGRLFRQVEQLARWLDTMRELNDSLRQQVRAMGKQINEIRAQLPAGDRVQPEPQPRQEPVPTRLEPTPLPELPPVPEFAPSPTPPADPKPAADWPELGDAAQERRERSLRDDGRAPPPTGLQEPSGACVAMAQAIQRRLVVVHAPEVSP